MEDVGDDAVEWGMLPRPPQATALVAAREVNCLRENEGMSIVVDPTSVEFLDSQPVRSTTVDPDGATPHQSTIPIGVTECDEQSVVMKLITRPQTLRVWVPDTGCPISRAQCQVWRQLIPWSQQSHPSWRVSE